MRSDRYLYLDDEGDVWLCVSDGEFNAATRCLGHASAARVPDDLADDHERVLREYRERCEGGRAYQQEGAYLWNRR